jgi:integrase
LLDRGIVLASLAAAIAIGATSMSDIALLAHLAPVLGDAPSGPTVRRALDLAGTAAMPDKIARARARARAHAWKLIEGTPAGFPWLAIAGKTLAGWLVIDMDATLVTAHSDKEGAAPTWKKGYGFHPPGAWLANTGECLAMLLRPGNAGSNTFTDHEEVLAAALWQVPARLRRRLLVRVDGAGASHELIKHLISLSSAVDRMKVGDYVQRTAGLTGQPGKPLEAATKAGHLAVLRTFFRDLQEWEQVPRRFDPQRALAVPRGIAALLGPDPRVIAGDIWAKLMWAGLNLKAGDLPQAQAGDFYPIELVRAVTLAWLFSGQRSDEIARLRVGCVRWQHDGTAITGDSGQVLARDAVCLLDVPTHKTGTAFTRPVDPVLGQALDAWQAVRPAQPKFTDRRAGELADLLFAFRARKVSTSYINNTVIPVLCRKAGVPAADVRGNITSHRARSTIASQPYNAKEPMTLFELQAWLGHRSPQSTQFYAKISPATLTRAYDDAGYFARNVRTIEVLVDRDAVTSGAAASGEPWQHYDLGHGYCACTFLEQCQHRMACAKCDFYTPKDSSRAQLPEARENLQKMRVMIPLTDDEQAAVDDGSAALSRLLGRLADVPTPGGPTPRQIGAPGQVALLPLIEVNRKPTR